MRSTALGIAVLGAATSTFLLATTTTRQAPSPSQRSRATDTPAVAHVPGGGPSGGDVVGLAIVASRPGTVLAAFEHGGVFRSHDYGATWTPADLGLPPDAGCELTAVDAEPGTLYAACWDDLFKTTDLGRRWRQLDVDHTRLPLIAPGDPRVVYQPPFHDVVRSDDGGQRWRRLVSTPAPACADGVALHPRVATTLFCAEEHRVSSSDDGGRTWRPFGRSLPHAATGGLAVHPSEPGVLLVGSSDGRIMVTRDAGRTWTQQVAAVEGDWTALAYLDARGDVVVGRAGSRVTRSRDGGHSWEPLPTPWPDDVLPRPFAIDPGDPWTAYVGTSSGLMVTTDFGQTWTRRADGVSRLTVSVALHEGPSTTTIYATSNRWSDAAVLFTSRDGGHSWHRARPDAIPDQAEVKTLRADGAGGLIVKAADRFLHLSRHASSWAPLDLPAEARLFAVDPAPEGGAAVLVASTSSRYQRSNDGGHTWTSGTLPDEWGLSSATLAHGRALLLGTFAAPGTGGLWRSADDGRRWQPVGAFGASVGRIGGLATDPFVEDLVFATVPTGIGGTGSSVYRSRDGGTTWTALSLPGLVLTFAIVPTRPATLLAQSVDGRLVSSVDAGASWQRIGAGLPDTVRLTGVTIDPRDPRGLVAGTEGRGVFVSVDTGTTWRAAGLATDWR
ncbi:MAG TPA: YCF48-related protein [Luteitalea sp.]|nr:YCF48-related protein [Luteitalea sp.]